MKLELFGWRPLKRLRNKDGGSSMKGIVILPFLQQSEILEKLSHGAFQPVLHTK
jgi:hypothetical protein